MIIGIVIGVIVLMALVVAHELGHAIVARRNGVVVREFGIGFPPAAKTWRPAKSFLGEKVAFSLNWLPLGGFVRLEGEHDAARGSGTYGAASFWVKTKILLAGVMVNWLVAAVLFTVLALIGLPKILPHQAALPFDTVVERSPVTIAQVAPDSPAKRAGLQPKDTLLAIDQIEITDAAELPSVTQRLAGKTVQVTYKRDDYVQQASVQLRDEAAAVNGGYLGVGPQQSESIRSTWSAPIAGVVTTGQLTYETVKGVGAIIVRGVSGLVGQIAGSESRRQSAQADLAFVGQSVAGPVGILGVLFPAVVDRGVTHLLLLAAIISLTLAVMNILPIPALDGGRWVTMALFRSLRKPLTKDREEAIQAVGFISLMLLTVVVTWNDIAKLF